MHRVETPTTTHEASHGSKQQFNVLSCHIRSRRAVGPGTMIDHAETQCRQCRLRQAAGCIMLCAWRRAGTGLMAQEFDTAPVP